MGDTDYPMAGAPGRRIAVVPRSVPYACEVCGRTVWLTKDDPLPDGWRVVEAAPGASGAWLYYCAGCAE